MRVSASVLRSLSVGPRLLLQRVLEDLVGVDLEDVAEIVAARVLPPGIDPRRVVDENGAFHPFTELLLLELAAIAGAAGWTTSMRRYGGTRLRRARWILRED